MANPNGNTKTLRPFKPQGKKALKGHLAVKVDKDALDKVKELENWQDRVRAFIEELANEPRSTKSTNAA